MSNYEEAMRKHYEWKGKLEVNSRVPITNKDELSIAYTPGVAAPCLAIRDSLEESFRLTRRGNLVAVITDGSAVLGLGNIGPEAGMPVMEGKCALFKTFADIDAFPICIKSNDVDEIVRTVYLISGSFGGINLEDISAPRCFEIERRLRELCDIPVFHDDQHGTAVIVGAALINALKLTGKKMDEVKTVINGAGSAGIAIAKHIMNLGIKNIVMLNSKGIINKNDTRLNDAQKEIATITNLDGMTGGLADALRGTDVFLGVSAPDCVTPEMIKSMNHDPIVFAMANPVPEISPELALSAGAAVVGTGRSDYPNQINNVLAFPGIFRGALDCRALAITEPMKLAASYAIASLVTDKELRPEYVLPSPFDKRVVSAVAAAVAEACDCKRA